MHAKSPYAACGREGRTVREHVIVAESVLGRPLPKGAVVHHADENKRNNDPSNLVICESQAYHLLLHRRLDAWKATGDANMRKCSLCHQYDHPSALRIYTRNTGRGLEVVQHATCARASARAFARTHGIEPMTPERYKERGARAGQTKIALNRERTRKASRTFAPVLSHDDGFQTRT